MLLFAAALTILTTFLFGLAPAVRMLRLEPLRVAARRRAQRLGGPAAAEPSRGALASAQMALAVVLLLGAGLMLARRSTPLMRVDLGFEPEHVLTLQLRPPEASYEKPETVVALYRTLLGARAGPARRRAAGIVRSLPLAASIGDWGLRRRGLRRDPRPATPRATGRSSPTARSRRSASGCCAGRTLLRTDTAETLAGGARQRDARARPTGPARIRSDERIRMGSRPEAALDDGRRASSRTCATTA